MKKGQAKKKHDSGIEHSTSFLASKAVVWWSKRLSPIHEVGCSIPQSCFFFFSCPFFNSFCLFPLFVLFCFIYNIYHITYLREINFPCTTHNEHSFFLFKYLTSYLSLKFRTNCNIERQRALLWTVRATTFGCAVTKITSHCLQRCHNVQTRKFAWNATWFYVNYIEHVKHFWK